MSRILVVGLNPAWQTILEFSAWSKGEVNRAETSVSMASGKGMNAARVLRALGEDVTLLQILGGGNGRRCLDVCEQAGINSLHAWVEEETRECLTLLDTSEASATELIAPFAAQSPGLGEALLATLPDDPKAFDAVVLCGSTPQACPAGIYGDIMNRFQPKVSVLDAFRDIPTELMEKATCVKVNRKEYLELSGGMADRKTLEAGTGPLFMITDGAEAAGMRTAGSGGTLLSTFSVPRLQGLRNAIGAGDAVTAALCKFLLDGLDPGEAFRRALAAGSASCLRLPPGEFLPEDYERILPLVEEHKEQNAPVNRL